MVARTLTDPRSESAPPWTCAPQAVNITDMRWTRTASYAALAVAAVQASACVPAVRGHVVSAAVRPIRVGAQPVGPLAALRVHHGGILQPAFPPAPPVDCTRVMCASASDPFSPMRLRGDRHLDGGCVWAEPTDPTFAGHRVAIIWPDGTYARFGKVIRVYSRTGRLLADSTHIFAGDGSAPTEDQLPARCLFDARDVLGIDVSSLHRATRRELRRWRVRH
jgi:hypothetical protein